MLKLKQWQLNHKMTCKCASLRFPEFAKVDYMYSRLVNKAHEFKVFAKIIYSLFRDKRNFQAVNIAHHTAHL